MIDLKKLTYKPGWKFELFRLSFADRNELLLRVTAAMPSLNGSPEPTYVQDDSTLPAFLTDEQLLSEIFSRVKRLEEHEACEWFKYEGRHLVDPHPELKEDKR